MAHPAGEVDELDGFGPDARRAVESAAAEANALGHDRVGTEHLLLGLLADHPSAASKALRDAGVTLAGARHKSSEAVVVDAEAGATPQPLPWTARAQRALGRSRRFSLAAGSDVVRSEHLLVAVLDVEGTAGQVLRGLGVDVDRLRAALSGGDPEPVEPAAAPVGCPSCRAALDDSLVSRTIPASDESARAAIVFSCGSCGAFLGVAPA